MVNNLIPGNAESGLSDEIKAIYGPNATPDSILQMFAALVVPTIQVNAPTGSTVGATDGTSTLTAAEKDGKWMFYVCNGTWTVTASLNGETTSAEITVTEVRQYRVDLSYT